MGWADMKRKLIQWIILAATNSNFIGFIEGRIYKGPLKKVCVPGLNCYSCPGALGSCPIGALQAVSGSPQFNISFYVIGLLTLFGVLLGRFICGFLCPFGLIQELLHKIPFFRIKNPWKWPRYIKYAILVIFVILMPILFTNILGGGDPAFCKYICPAGTLTGAFPLLSINADLRGAVGWLFGLKLSILILVIFGCLLIYRFFCRYLCPLGAIYSLFNRISIYQLRHNPVKCTHCGQCAKACRMDVDPSVTPASPECIRCGDCVKACQFGALHMGFTKGAQCGQAPCKGCTGK